MRTKLVNVKTSPCDVRITRPGPLGNPHPIGYCHHCGTEHDRAGAIEAYRRTFAMRIQNPEWVNKHLLPLRGKTIGCWCTPLPCHGDVIIEWLDVYNQTEKES